MFIPTDFLIMNPGVMLSFEIDDSGLFDTCFIDVVMFDRNYNAKTRRLITLDEAQDAKELSLILNFMREEQRAFIRNSQQKQPL